MIFTDAELEAGRKLFAGPCDFMLGVAGLEQLPGYDLPEIAFAGRSNVGKSSLVNALTGRKTLARTSNTPGRTQQLNYFSLAGRLYLVDMPGYGYAKVSKEQKSQWDDLIFAYLRGRPNLRCVLILIDSRHGLKENDLDLMTMMDEAGVSYRIILTKSDKAKASDLEALVAQTKSTISKNAAAFADVMMTSAEKNTGLEELRAVITGFARDY